jgi:hypothetical protein
MRKVMLRVLRRELMLQMEKIYHLDATANWMRICKVSKVKKGI